MKARPVAVVVLAASTARADLPAPRLVPELAPPSDRAADAASDADPWSGRPRSIQLQGGAPGGPTGIVGASFEIAPVRYLVLGAGGGWAPDGARAAFLPRLRLPLGRLFAVGLGFPLSFGPYQFSLQQAEQCPDAGCAIDYRTTRTWAIAVWGHLEPNVEIRVSPAVALRLFGGSAKVLNGESDRCESTLVRGCPSNVGEQKWYGGLAVGYAW